MDSWLESIHKVVKNVFKEYQTKDMNDLKCHLLQTTDVIYQVASQYQKETGKSLKNSNKPLGKDDQRKTNSDLALMEKNIKHIIKMFKETTEARSKFMREFPKWKKLREENIKILKNTGKLMNTEKFNCNVSKLVGSSVGIVGGSISLTAAILIPFTAGLSIPFIVGGAVVGGLGSATTVGASVAEISLLIKRINEAKEILKKDQEAFKFMRQWVDHSKKLIDVIEAIMQVRWGQELLEDIKKFIRNCNNFSQIIKTTRFQELIRKYIELIFPQSKFWVQIFPILIGFIMTSITFKEENRFVLESAIITLRITMGLCTTLDCGVDAMMAGLTMRGGVPFGSFGKAVAQVPNAGSMGKAVAQVRIAGSIGKAVAHGTFAVVGMALDVTNLVLTSIDVHKGSISKQGKSVLDAAKQLEDELYVLEKVYNEMITLK